MNVKTSKQARAIIDLYESMPKHVRQLIKKRILKDNIEYNQIDTSELTNMSDESMRDVWETSENDHWDEFFKSNKDDV